jgi:hypothetical protein
MTLGPAAAVLVDVSFHSLHDTKYTRLIVISRGKGDASECPGTVSHVVMRLPAGAFMLNRNPGPQIQAWLHEVRL